MMSSEFLRDLYLTGITFWIKLWHQSSNIKEYGLNRITNRLCTSVFTEPFVHFEMIIFVSEAGHKDLAEHLLSQMCQNCDVLWILLLRKWLSWCPNGSVTPRSPSDFPFDYCWCLDWRKGCYSNTSPLILFYVLQWGGKCSCHDNTSSHSLGVNSSSQKIRWRNNSLVVFSA